MHELRENPFRDHGRWWWRDDKQVSRGPYKTQIDAIRALCNHYDPSPTAWQRFKTLVSEFVRS